MNQDPPFPHPHPQDLHPDQLVQLPPAGGVRGEHLDHRPLLHSLQVKINNGPVIRFPCGINSKLSTFQCDTVQI